MREGEALAGKYRTVKCGFERLAGKELTISTERWEAALRLMLDHSISQCGACSFVGVHPKTFRRSRPPANPEISKEMKAFAAKCRIGYRRIGMLSERMDMIMNHKKLYRLYKDEKSRVRHRNGRKRARELGMPMPVAL